MNDEQPRDIFKRAKEFALRIIKLYCSLPNHKAVQVMGGQFLRSGTSLGAHLREARRGRSKAEYISKVQLGLQELDECQYWLELLKESRLVINREIDLLIKESDELIAILTTCVKKEKAGRQTSRR